MLTASDAAVDDLFGISVVIDGSRVMVGAKQHEAPGGWLAGAAYLFGLPISTSYCGPAAPNSSGQPAVIGATGSTVVSHGDPELRASQMPTNQFGYFLVSATQDFQQGVGGSQGNLCLGGTIGRFTQQVQSTGFGGYFEIVVDLTDMPTPGAPTVLPGETWNFQCWFRDFNPGPTSNLTDAVSITFQ